MAVTQRIHFNSVAAGGGATNFAKTPRCRLLMALREDQCQVCDAVHRINLNCPLTGQSGDNCKLMEVKPGKQVNGSHAPLASSWKPSPASKLMEAKTGWQVNGSQARQASSWSPSPSSTLMGAKPRKQVNGSQAPQASQWRSSPASKLMEVKLR